MGAAEKSTRTGSPGRLLERLSNSQNDSAPSTGPPMSAARTQSSGTSGIPKKSSPAGMAAPPSRWRASNEGFNGGGTILDFS
jgi:hypothetical protein